MPPVPAGGTGRCAAALPPTRATCAGYKVRLRSEESALRVGGVVELEVYGTARGSGAPCAPAEDHFQLWLSGPSASGKEATAAATSTPEPGVFAVRLPRAGRWTARGMWSMDGPSKQIVLGASHNRHFFGPGTFDVFGGGKAAFHIQGKRDALGGVKDSTLVQWEDSPLPPITFTLPSNAGSLQGGAQPCTAEQMYESSTSGVYDWGESSWEVRRF